MRTLIRVVMVLATLVVAVLAILFGIFQSAPTGFFSAPNSPQDRLKGYILLAVGATMVLASFSLLRRKNLIPLCICIASVFVGVISMGGLNQDMVYVILPYVQGMVLAFVIDLLIGKKFPEAERPNDKQKEQKVNKYLIGIPIVLLLLAGLYINFGQYWIAEVKDANIQRNEISSLGYQLYSPGLVPTGYFVRETRLGGIRSDYFYSEYRNREQQYFMLAQFSKPKNLSLHEPKCQIYGDRSDSFEIQDIYGTTSGINSTCQEVLTPKGIKIYLMSYEIVTKGNYAAALIDDTLITVTGYSFSEDELVRMFDSLEKGSPPVRSPDKRFY